MKKNLIITVQAILLCWIVSTVWASLSGCSNEFIELGPDDDADVTQDTAADEADTADDTVEEVEAEIETEIEEDAGADEAEPEDAVEPEDVAEIEDEVESDAGTTTCRDFESPTDPCSGREWLESGAHSGHYVCNFGEPTGMASLELPGGLTTAPVTIDVWFQVIDGSWPAGWGIGPMMFSPPADLYVHRDTVDWVWTMGWIHLTVAYVPGAWVREPSVRTVHVTTTFEAVPLPAVTLEQDVDLFTPAYFDPTTFAFGNVRIDDLCVTQ